MTPRFTFEKWAFELELHREYTELADGSTQHLGRVWRPFGSSFSGEWDARSVRMSVPNPTSVHVSRPASFCLGR
jgi:hypothetical protein